eukprot:4866882-Pleurochrysis_carterae.AAC.3
MALITRGDAALNDYVAHLRGKAETQSIHASAMQSMPMMATTAGAKMTWLGDTGASMHCITDTSLAVKGSLRTNTTVIVTVNGTTTPKYRYDADLPLRTDKENTVAIRFKNMLRSSHARQPRINERSDDDRRASAKRFNHRRAKVLKLLPQCTRDAPSAWATISRATLHAKRASMQTATPFIQMRIGQFQLQPETSSATTFIT